MLSKTAENLYWAARYIERADSIARLLEVAYRIHLIPNATTSYNNEWDSILQTLRIKEEYLEKNKVIKKEQRKHERIEVTDSQDIDPIETDEWLESLSAVIQKDGKIYFYLVKLLILVVQQLVQMVLVLLLYLQQA